MNMFKNILPRGPTTCKLNMFNIYDVKEFFMYVIACYFSYLALALRLRFGLPARCIVADACS